MARHWSGKAYHANHWKTGHWWETTAVPVEGHWRTRHWVGQQYHAKHWIGTHSALLTATANPAHWARHQWVGQHYVPNHWIGTHPNKIVPLPAGTHPVGRLSHMSLLALPIRRYPSVGIRPASPPSAHPVARLSHMELTALPGPRRKRGFKDKAGTPGPGAPSETPYVTIYRRRRR